MHLHAARFKGAEYARSVFCATVPAGTSPDDLLVKDFWAHVAYKLKQGDRIEVTPDDGAYFVELMVVAAPGTGASQTWAKVKALRFVDLQDEEAIAEAETADAYELKWRGPHGKHSVVRKADGRIMFEGGATKADAAGWLADHLKVAA